MTDKRNPFWKTMRYQEQRAKIIWKEWDEGCKKKQEPRVEEKVEASMRCQFQPSKDFFLSLFSSSNIQHSARCVAVTVNLLRRMYFPNPTHFLVSLLFGLGTKKKRTNKHHENQVKLIQRWNALANVCRTWMHYHFRHAITPSYPLMLFIGSFTPSTSFSSFFFQLPYVTEI